LIGIIVFLHLSDAQLLAVLTYDIYN